MNKKILTNIYNFLSNPSNRLTDSDYDTWESNFLNDRGVQGNVYNYLKQRNLTQSNLNEWRDNIFSKPVTSNGKSPLNQLDPGIKQDRLLSPIIPKEINADKQITLFNPTDWYLGNINEELKNKNKRKKSNVDKLLEPVEDKKVDKDVKVENDKVSNEKIDKKIDIKPITVTDKRTVISDRTNIPNFKIKTAFTPEYVTMMDNKNADKDLLSKYLTSQYFSKKKLFKNVTGKSNILAYDIEDYGHKKLKRDIKKNLKQNPDAFPYLSDVDIDGVIQATIGAEIANEKYNIKRNNMHRAIDDAEKNGKDLTKLTDEYNLLEINSNKNKDEVNLANANYKLRDPNLSEQEREKINSEISNLIDQAFYEDELSYDATTRMFLPTGNRVPKPNYKKIKLFHDLETGRNLDIQESSNQGGVGDPIDITDKYQLYLTQFDGSSDDLLGRYNAELLYNEKGFNLENEQTGNYYVGNVYARSYLNDKGYTANADGVYQNVKLGDLTKLSNVLDKSNFLLGKEIYMSKGDIVPVDYTDKPYTNEAEFIDYLKIRRNTSLDIAAKKKALWYSYHLNQDPTTLKTTKGLFIGTAFETLFGPLSQEVLPITNRKIVDQQEQIINEIGLDVSASQAEAFERDFTDKLLETGGGFLPLITLYFPLLNKGQTLLGVNRAFAKILRPNYIKNGKVYTSSQITTLAAKNKQTISSFTKANGYAALSPSLHKKAMHTICMGVVEDIKMREGFQLLGREDLAFDRFVGFGFLTVPKIIPFKAPMFKNNLLNTWSNSTFKSAPAFAIAVPGGDIAGGIWKDITNTEELQTFIKHHWSDKDKKHHDILLNLISGKLLSLTHLKSIDLKTTQQIQNFKINAQEGILKHYTEIENKSKDKDVFKFIEENPNDQSVVRYLRDIGDYYLAEQRLDQINQLDNYTNPSKAKATYEKENKPMIDLFKANGKTLEVKTTDQDLYRIDGYDKNGKPILVPVNALYTPLGEAQKIYNKKGELIISGKAGKNKAFIIYDIKNGSIGKTAHETGHAFWDLMFSGKSIQVKQKFQRSFKMVLEDIKLEDGRNLYEVIKEDKEIPGEVKVEEMLQYSAEYLSKAEYYTQLVDNSAFSKLKRFLGGYFKSETGLDLDLSQKQKIINLIGGYAVGVQKGTGGIPELIKLSEMVEAGETNKGQKSTKEINSKVDQIKKQRNVLLSEIQELRLTKPENYLEVIEQNKVKVKELSDEIKKLQGRVVVIEQNKEKDADLMKKIDKYMVSKKTGKRYTTKDDFKTSEEYKEALKLFDMNNKTLQGLILQNMEGVLTTQESRIQFERKVKEKLEFRFLKDFDPSKNPSLFGWLTGVSGGRGQSIIYRAKGDVINDYKKDPLRGSTSLDALMEAGFNVEDAGTGTSGKQVEEIKKNIPSIVVTEKLTVPEFRFKEVEVEGVNGEKKLEIQQVVNENPIDIQNVVDKAKQDASKLDFTKEGAKDIVSYKNVVKNYRNTIEKEVVVDIVGITKSTYDVMKVDDAKTLTQTDLLNFDNFIKTTKGDILNNNLVTTLLSLSKGSQDVFDPITGENVAPELIKGKATGVPTVLQKIPLLYVKVDRTVRRTNLSPYDISPRFKNYLDVVQRINLDLSIEGGKANEADLKFKEEFEADFLSYIDNAKNKSQIVKGIVQQIGKAIYVQSVKTVIPELVDAGDLKIRYSIANALNQISAGMNPSLATKTLTKSPEALIAASKILTEKVIEEKQIEQYFPDDSKGKSDLIKAIQENKGMRAEAIIGEISKLEAEKSGMSEKELEAQEKEYAKNIKNISIKFKVDPKRTSLKEVNNDADLISQRRDFDVQVLNNFPDIRLLPENVVSILKTQFGFNSRSRKENDVYLRKNGKTWAETLIKYYGEGRKITGNGEKYDGRYDACYVPNWGTLKKQIANKRKQLEADGIKGQEFNDALVEFVREKLTSQVKNKDGKLKFTFEETQTANDALAKDFYMSLAKVVKSQGKIGLENLLVHLAMQTNHSTGISKGVFYNVRSISKQGSSPTEENKGIEDHWEHELQLLNNTDFFVEMVNRHKNVGEGSTFETELDLLLENSQQSLIEKDLQLTNDARGRTFYPGKATLFDNFLANVLTTRGSSENQLLLSGEYKGKTVDEMLFKTITETKIIEYLKTIPEKDWNALANEIDLNNKNKETETKNRKLLDKIGLASKDLTRKEVNDALRIVDEALDKGRIKIKDTRGMSTFDFDETLIVKGENFVTATRGKETKKISSENFPVEGPKLQAEGWKFDFTDFVNVKGGVDGPLLQKMKNQIEKYGSENVFVLTARPAESATAIHGWLKSKGINIPIENITGLGNSTGEAKALWFLEKYAEGYNDMYFVDDALQNIKAVKNVLNQLDVKSNVQIVRSKATKDLNAEFNKILETVTGVKAEEDVSRVRAQIVGGTKWTKSVIVPGAQDFMGLMQNLLGTGKEGIKNKKFYQENLIIPFAEGTNKMNHAKQRLSEDYKKLVKDLPKVNKKLSSKISKDSPFTVDQAVRVYIWDSLGFEVPGTNKADLKEMIDFVRKDPKLTAFANKLKEITGDLYIEPGEYWVAETILSDLNKLVQFVGRKKYLAEFIENKNIIFSEENLNKIELTQGTKFREALEDILYRMETGSNRPTGTNRLANAHMNFINGSVGATMFLNIRSATLQTISMTNYINWGENNPIAAAKAFGNQKQYWKDFAYIWNSSMLKQRRRGLEYNVQEAELAAAVEGAENKAKAAMAWLIKKGFTPTQIADSFAISAGGASYYRNRIKMYKKQGLSEKEAEEKAWLDFQETTERAQQSSRADLISQQQASVLGRTILAWANTPMQYMRIQEKEARDIINGRYDGFLGENSLTQKLSKIAYYGAVQSVIFAALQNALFAFGLDEEEDLDDKDFAERVERVVNTVVDGQLRGIGQPGALLSAIKNTIIEYHNQNQRGYRADHTQTMIQLTSYSPVIGSKLRKFKPQGLDAFKFKKDLIKYTGLSLDNPANLAIGNIIESTTNIPIARIIMKIDNLREAADDRNQYWQRLALLMGWSKWNVGAVNEELEELKIKMEKEQKEFKVNQKLIEKAKKQEETQKIYEEQQEEEIKEGKEVTCIAVNKNNERCGLKVVNGTKYCTVHQPTEKRADGKKVQCKKIKSDGKQCKMQTNNKSGLCYYHD